MLIFSGGYGSDGGQSMERSDCVFVAGLPPSATEEEIAEYFGAIGIIKVSTNQPIELNKITDFTYFMICDCCNCADGPKNRKAKGLDVQGQDDRKA